MRIEGIIWLRQIVDKLALKHQVDVNEVEETLNNKPKIRFVEKGLRKNENIYMALGKQTPVAIFRSSSFTNSQNRHWY
jgi:hypothetical protein